MTSTEQMLTMTCHLMLKQFFYEEPIIKRRNLKRKGNPMQRFDKKNYEKCR